MLNYYKYCFALLLLLGLTNANAQDDLLDLLDEQEEPETIYTTGTFKSTRTINSVSVDLQAVGELQFMISHRFGPISERYAELFGLDHSQIRLGFEYGVTPRLAVGIGRSRELGITDASVKYKILRQSSGLKNMPVTVVLNSNVSHQIADFPSPDAKDGFVERLHYSTQLLIARKFSDRFSLQLNPTYSHFNTISNVHQVHDQISLGVSARMKYSQRFGFLVDYYYITNDEVKGLYNEPLSVAWFVETGGHVFQLLVSNTTGMTERLYLSNTLGSWQDTQLFFGFNIARNFNVKRGRKNNHRVPE